MKNSLKLWALFIGIYFPLTMQAQHRYLDTAWVATSPAVATAYYHTASVVHNGKLIVTGNILDGTDTDVYTFKLDSNGDTLWSKRQSGNLTGGGNDYGIDVVTTNSGDVIVTAAIENNTTGYDYAVYRYSGTNGALEWSYVWDGNSGIDIPAKVVVKDAINAVFVVGGSQAASGGLSDFGVIKLDTSATFKWEHFYGGSLHDAAVSANTAVLNQYLLTVGASNQSPGTWAIVGRMIKISDGSTFSTTTIDTTGATMVEARAMAMDSLNNVYITGYGEVGGDRYMELVKLDSSLNEVYVKTLDNPYDDAGNDVAVDANGNVYVAGYTEQTNGERRAMLIKYNSSGTEQWTALYTSQLPVTSEATKIELNSSGEIFITGTVERDTVGSFFFSQYSSDGALLISAEFESDTLDFNAYDIAIDEDDIYVTGLANGTGGATTRVLKYSILQDVNPSYFYLSGEKSYWCQQPGMYAFTLSDTSEFTGYNPAIVSDSVYYPADGMHHVYFNHSATNAQIDSMINAIEGNVKFSKEYMVATLTRNNDQPYEKEYFAGLNNSISIIFEDPGLSITEIDSFAALYETTVIFKPDAGVMGGVYILQPDRMRTLYNWNSPTLTMDLARDMQEFDSLDFVKAVDPGMLMFRPHSPDDSLYDQMWWARDTVPYVCNGTEVYPTSIDLDCAWNFQNEINSGPSYSGVNRVVAVIDFDGVEYSHPDCSGMYTTTGYVAPSSGSAVVPFYNDLYIGTDPNRVHGQNVSGIIGARINNDEGIAGVAYGSRVMPCIMQGYTDNFNALLMKIMDLNGTENEVDVINMSFGFAGMTVGEATGFTFYHSLQMCSEEGRPDPAEIEDPRGIVLVASSGNDNGYVTQVPANISFVLSVGATNPFDQRKSSGDNFNPSAYSWGGSYFNYLDVSAPGICIWSTDYTDNNPEWPADVNGYATGDYNLFSGTSASAPIVSGIAALVLEKDSTLTAEEVYDAIRYSCEKVGGYPYSNTWESGRCLELGYGRVNACNALNKVDELTIPENPQIGFSVIHPNPVNGLLWATVNGTSNYSVSIVNIMGEVIYRSGANSENYFELDLSQFADGIYILNVTDLDTQESHTSKVIKQ